jgi:outer membrane protein assembly factor BamE
MIRRIMTTSWRLPRRSWNALLALMLCIAGCVYRVDVQQGNLLRAADIEAIQPGMTRSQVKFLLGTPVVEDAFHHDRWDYVYYMRKGATGHADKRWIIVFFADDKVKEVRRDVPFANS